MKKFLFLMMLLCFGAGCAKKTSAVHPLSPEVQQGSEIAAAVVSGDFKRFAKAAEGEAELPEKEEEQFRKSCIRLTENFGQPESFRYMGELKTPLLINQIYAMRFRKKQSDGKWVEHDQLFQLIFGKNNDRYKLLGMRFI